MLRHQQPLLFSQQTAQIHIINVIKLNIKQISMLNSQRIKLLATNNLQHLSPTLTPLKISHKNVKIQDKNNSQQKIEYLNISQSDNWCDCQQSEQQQNYQYEQYETLQVQQKGMFTIHEEQSYEYQSETSLKNTRRVHIKSQILQEISTIKALIDSSANPFKSIQNQYAGQIESFQIQHQSQNPKAQQIPQTTHKNQKPVNTEQNWSTKNTSPQNITKIQLSSCQNNKQNVQENQNNVSRVQSVNNDQNKQLSVNFDQIRLPLQKLRFNSKYNVVYDHYTSVQQQVGIIYQCSHDQFKRVVDILDNEGIKLVKQPKRLKTQPINYSNICSQTKKGIKRIENNYIRHQKTNDCTTPQNKLSITKQTLFSPNTTSKTFRNLKPTAHYTIKKKKGISKVSLLQKATLIR